MSDGDDFNRLEVIDPQGDVRFFELNPEQGVTTIGSDGKSDIVLHSPGLEPVHAVLFYDTRTCQLLLYSDKTPTFLNDDKAPLPLHKRVLEDGDTLRVNGHVLVFLGSALPASQMTLEGKARPVSGKPAPINVPPALPPASQSQQVQQANLSTPSRAHIDVSQTECVVQAGQSIRISVRVHHDDRRAQLPNVTFLVWAKAAPDPDKGGYGQRIMLPKDAQELHVPAGSSELTDIELKANTACSRPYAIDIWAHSAELGYQESKRINVWVYPGDGASTTRPANLVLDMPEREATADTSQPAHYQFALSNSGDRQANILITVDPAFPNSPGQNNGHWNDDWVIRKPGNVYLHNGDSALLNFSVDITGVSDTQAGVYPLLVTASSLAYPQSRCSVVALLKVEPRAEFDVSGLEPMVVSQSAWLGWLGRQRERRARCVVQNRSNCKAPFVLGVTDRAGECDFKVEIYDPTAGAQQRRSLQPSPARVDIGAGEEREVTVLITPRPRTHKFIAFAPQVMDYTLTTTMQRIPPLAPRQVMGQVKSLAWLHPLAAVLVLMTTLITLMIILWPRVGMFELNETPDAISVNGGEGVRTRWTTWAATSASIEPERGEVATLGQITLVPTLTLASDASANPASTVTSVITLTALNFLNTTLFPRGGDVHKRLTQWPFGNIFMDIETRTVNIKPLIVNVKSFLAESNLGLSEVITVEKGRAVKVDWLEVTNARKLELLRSDGVPSPLIPNSDYSAGFVTLDGFNTSGTVVISLKASNPYAIVAVTKSVTVNVIPSNPQVLRFDVTPGEALGVKGQVRAIWETNGVSVTLQADGPDRTGVPMSQNRLGQLDLLPLDAISDTTKPTQKVIYTLTPYNEGRMGDLVTRTVVWNPDPQSLGDAEICASFQFTPSANTQVQLGEDNAKNENVQFVVHLDKNYSTTIEIGELSYFSRPVYSDSIVTGVVSVPVQAAGTFPFKLKVTREGLTDKPTICPLVLTVLPAKIPLPQILTANVFDSIGNVPSKTDNSWNLKAGQDYTVKWTSSENTTKVRVNIRGVNEFGPAESRTFRARNADNIESYSLIPVRSDGVEGPIYPLRFSVSPLAEPNQVEAITIKVDDKSTLLKWDYSDTDAIQGFTVFRTDRQTKQTKVIKRYKKDEITNIASFNYSDPDYTCGQTYNIVVRYTNEESTVVDGSTTAKNTVSSPDCPVPLTPTPSPTALPPTDIPPQPGNAPAQDPAQPTAIP